MNKYKYYIMFGVTLIGALLIMFYNPNKKYLGVYKDDVTIAYSFNEIDYTWVYDITNEIFIIKEIDSEKWNLTPIKDGETLLTFYCLNNNDPTNQKYKIEYKFTVKGKKIYWTDGSGYGLLDYPNPY